MMMEKTRSKNNKIEDWILIFITSSILLWTIKVALNNPNEVKLVYQALVKMLRPFSL